MSWSKTHRVIADNASKSLPEDTLAAWTKVRQEFNRDPSKPNPYEEPETCEFSGMLLTDSCVHSPKQSSRWKLSGVNLKTTNQANIEAMSPRTQ